MLKLLTIHISFLDNADLGLRIISNHPAIDPEKIVELLSDSLTPHIGDSLSRYYSGSIENDCKNSIH